MKIKIKSKAIAFKSFVDIDDAIISGSTFRGKCFLLEILEIRRDPKKQTKFKVALNKMLNNFGGIKVGEFIELSTRYDRPTYGTINANKQQYHIMDLLLDFLVTDDYLTRDCYIPGQKSFAFSPTEKLVKLLNNSSYVIEEVQLKNTKSSINGIFDYSHVKVNIDKLTSIANTDIQYYGRIATALRCVKQICGMEDGKGSVKEFENSKRITNPIIQMKSEWREALYSKNGDLDTPVDIDMCSAGLQLLIKDVNNGEIPTDLIEVLRHGASDALFGHLQLVHRRKCGDHTLSHKEILLKLLYGKSGGNIKGWGTAIKIFRNAHPIFEKVWLHTRELHNNGVNVALHTQQLEAKLMRPFFEKHAKTAVACYDGILVFSETTKNDLLDEFANAGVIVKIKPFKK